MLFLMRSKFGKTRIPDQVVQPPVNPYCIEALLRDLAQLHIIVDMLCENGFILKVIGVFHMNPETAVRTAPDPKKIRTHIAPQ